MISIHAPVKGATHVIDICVFQARDFNPRTREGCDGQYINVRRQARNFNPRTREGCDAFNMRKTESI